ISALAGEMLVQGLIAGLFGWLLGMIGLDPTTGVQRYTFHQLFLWDGFGVISGVLAIYALPEMMQLGRRSRGAAAEAQPPAIKYTYAEVWSGVFENVRHWGLTVTTSVLGTFIGMIPGLGGEAAGWLNYAFAASRYGGRKSFGQGAIEGVIAPSTGMNSKEGGGLLPTLFFGVPAGSGMAIMLGALIMLGIQPGPMIIVKHLPLVWSLIWAIAISNLVCTTILVLASKHMSAITQIRTDVLVPIVLTFTLLGTYLAKGHWQSLVVFAALGAIGYVMARNHWPRPCFIIGLVLGPIAERSFHKAMALYGPSFLLQATSLVMMAVIALALAFNLARRRKSADDGPDAITSSGGLR
ncbi:MAG: tripartite tricarboxylate transporter permease, partial [Stellaceae bacterium]